MTAMNKNIIRKCGKLFHRKKRKADFTTEQFVNLPEDGAKITRTLSTQASDNTRLNTSVAGATLDECQTIRESDEPEMSALPLYAIPHKHVNRKNAQAFEETDTETSRSSNPESFHGNPESLHSSDGLASQEDSDDDAETAICVDYQHMALWVQQANSIHGSFGQRQNEEVGTNLPQTNTRKHSDQMYENVDLQCSAQKSPQEEQTNSTAIYALECHSEHSKTAKPEELALAGKLQERSISVVHEKRFVGSHSNSLMTENQGQSPTDGIPISVASQRKEGYGISDRHKHSMIEDRKSSTMAPSPTEDAISDEDEDTIHVDYKTVASWLQKRSDSQDSSNHEEEHIAQPIGDSGITEPEDNMMENQTETTVRSRSNKHHSYVNVTSTGEIRLPTPDRYSSASQLRGKVNQYYNVEFFPTPGQRTTDQGDFYSETQNKTLDNKRTEYSEDEASHGDVSRNLERPNDHDMVGSSKSNDGSLCTDASQLETVDMRTCNSRGRMSESQATDSSQRILSIFLADNDIYC